MSPSAAKLFVRHNCLCAALLLAVMAAGCVEQDATRPVADVDAPSIREAWTTSTIHGAPTPPLPYRTERVFGEFQFQQPVVLTNAPGTDSMFLLELSGKIYELTSEEAESPRLVGNLSDHVDRLDASLGLAFHPDFKNNREIYVCYRRRGDLENGSTVSRFRLTKETPWRIETDSEQQLYTWRAGGHNGGCVKFGPDGYLYVSAGDSASPFPPDPLKAGQDLGTLLSKIVRIDVDHRDPPLAYRVPADNPFVDLDEARPEVYAYGFRNPWRMAFDRETGDLWVGDVGWELWEMIYRVESGGNYGWSIVEGPQPVDAAGQRGPTPILKPVASHSHTEARSITGGQVYYGERLPELRGAYIYGDHVTGRIWKLHKRGEVVDGPTQIARAPLQIICFGLHNNGELYIVDYVGSIHRLVPQENNENRSFPVTLSESGLFSNTTQHELASGVVPYRINAEPWMDGANASRFVAIPGDEKIGIYRAGGGHANWDGKHRGSWKFPKDSVLGKTISLGNRRIETQLLHYDGQAWQAYTYLWNESQTDASLADDKSTVLDIDVDGAATRWPVSNRGDCMICHSNANDMLLGFKPLQLASPTTGEAQTDELASLTAAGLFEETPQRNSTLTDPFDTSADLDVRARSYLHVNCAHCHRPQGGGSVAMNVLFDTDAMRIVDEAPLQGNFGIEHAKVVAPGAPFHSTLLYRFSKLGPGHMPKLGGLDVDDAGARLLHDWIASLDGSQHPASPIADEITSLETDEQWTEFLSDPAHSLAVAHAIRTDAIPVATRDRVIAVSRTLPDICRDLFEPFVPREQRKQRLGDTIDREFILSQRGDATRGQRLFASDSLSCKTCHSTRPGEKGIGPNLSELPEGSYKRGEILENILQPSKKISEAYQTLVVQTADGELLTGVASREGEILVLRDAQNKVYRLSPDDIEFQKRSDVSLMPEKLLASLSLEEARDLIEFLLSLKR